VTDSTLVIERAWTSNTYPARDRGLTTPPYLPYAVPVDSVESITQVTPLWSVTGLLIGVGVLAVVIVILDSVFDPVEYDY